MHTAAEKTTHPTAPVRQVGAQGAFFRKADERSFFGAEQDRGQDSFFSPSSVQPKLTVSQPDDPLEREADATADRVMRMEAPPAPGERKEEKLQRRPEEDNEEDISAAGPQVSRMSSRAERGSPQSVIYRSAISVFRRDDSGNRSSTNIHGPPHNRGAPSTPSIQREGRGPPAVTPHFESALSASKGGGSPMPADTRSNMESRFGTDFSSVRIHTGTGAESLSTSIRAQAFAHGGDIYFNEGQWAPGTEAGKRLLAHELTHVIQQGASVPRAGTEETVTRQPIVARSVGKSAAIQSAAPNIPTITRSATSTLQRVAADDFSNKAGGSALPEEARAFLEDYYTTNLSDIRIHTDADAMRLCLQAGRPALAQGTHICVLPALYRPDTEDGAKLISGKVSESLAQRGKLAGNTANDALGGLFQQISEAAKATIETAQARQNAPPTPGEPVPSIEPKKGKGDVGEKSTASKKKKGASRKARKRGELADAPMPPAAKGKKHSPRSPSEDPAFQRVIRTTNKTAKAQKDHDPAEKKSADAQNAAEAVPAEAESKAQDKKTTALGAAALQDIAFDAKAFEQELREKIEAATPQTLEEADDFKENNRVGEVKAAVGQKVAEGKAETTGPVANEAATPMAVNPADAKQPVALPSTPAGPRPAIPGAKDAAPKKKTADEISLEEQSKSLDEDMAANGVTEAQLASAEEPTFGKALNEKKAAQADAAQAPLTYRKTETGVLGEAKAEAQGDAAKAMTVMHGARSKVANGVVAQQQTAKGRDEEKRAEVVREIGKKYEAAKVLVDAALETADKEANAIFDAGAEAARKLFEDHVDREMRLYKIKRYSGFWGSARWVKDKLFGMPDAVNRFYKDGRDLYLQKMDSVIHAVALSVATNLGKAKKAIADGKGEIDAYVAQLPKDLQSVGKDAADDISAKFDELEHAVADKRDALKEGLAKKYVDNLKQLDSRIEELKAANQGLVDAVIGALKAIYRVIRDLTELFTTILARLASIIGVVISNPSGFFANVGRAFRAGFDAFIAKFDQYLEEGLMAWLMTNLGISGLQLPKTFSLTSIFGLVMQVVGFTPEKVEERAVAVLGARQVAALKTSGGILHRIYAEGPGALWDIVAEKLSDLREIVWEALKSFLQKRIVEEAIKMLLMMLNPIGGFIKVCMLVYDFLMMLVRFKDRIIELLDTILNAVVNIANGAIDGAAKAIEAAFAKSIPVIIGFLAGLLRLNNIAAAVRGIIMRIQGRVEKVLDWGLMKAAAFVKKGVAVVKRGGQVVVEKGKAAASAVAGWLGLRKSFTVRPGESHTLYFNPQTSQLMMASSPIVFRRLLSTLVIPPAKQSRLNPVRAELMQYLLAVDDLIANTTMNEARKNSQISAILELIGPDIAELLRQTSGALLRSEPPAYGGLHGGFGSSMRVRITEGRPATTGSQPDIGGGHWDNLRKRKTSQGSKDTFYIRAHLLNDKLGGPGNTWDNLTILSQRANNRDWYGSGSHETAVETRLKGALSKPGKGFIYIVTAVYGRNLNTPMIAAVQAQIDHKSGLTASAAPVPDNPHMSAYTVAQLRVVLSIVQSERFVPTAFQCTIRELDPSTGDEVTASDHNINRTIHNDISSAHYL